MMIALFVLREFIYGELLVRHLGMAFPFLESHPDLVMVSELFAIF